MGKANKKTANGAQHSFQVGDFLYKQSHPDMEDRVRFYMVVGLVGKSTVEVCLVEPQVVKKLGGAWKWEKVKPSGMRSDERVFRARVVKITAEEMAPYTSKPHDSEQVNILRGSQGLHKWDGKPLTRGSAY